MDKKKKRNNKNRAVEVNFLKKGKFELDLWLCDPQPSKKEEKRTILIQPRPLFPWIDVDSRENTSKRTELLDKVWMSTKIRSNYRRKWLSGRDCEIEKETYLNCEPENKNNIFIKM